MGRAQLLACLAAAALAAQPFPVQQMGAGQVDAEPGLAEAGDRLTVPALGCLALADQRAAHPRHRAVLVLRDLDGLDEQAAGALLNAPAATVRSRLFRARRSFRKAWLP